MGTTSTITIHLSQEAQRAALLAGQPAQETQVYPVTTAEDLAALLALPGSVVHADGTASHNGHTWEHGSFFMTLRLDARPVDAAAAIAAVAEATARRAEKEKAEAEARRAADEREYAARAARQAEAENAERAAKERAAAAAEEREAKRLAELASLDAALRRVLTAEEAAAVYAGEHAKVQVQLGVLSLDAARTRLKDALLPLPARVVLKKPRDDYGDLIAGSFEVDEGEDATLSIEEAQRALQVRADVTRALNAAPEGMITEFTAELNVHRFVAEDDDDLHGTPAPRNIGLYVRMTLAGGAVLVKEVAV